MTSTTVVFRMNATFCLLESVYINVRVVITSQLSLLPRLQFSQTVSQEAGASDNFYFMAISNNHADWMGEQKKILEYR